MANVIVPNAVGHKANNNNVQKDDNLFQKTLEYVLRAPKTEQQVKQWLFKKRKEGEFLPIDEIINRLKDLGYINDADYAVRFAEAKSTKYGMKTIKAKLMIKGISREYIDELETPDQTDLAHALAEKYMRNKTPSLKTFEKLYRYLLSKGLNYDIIGAVMTGYKGRQE